ncbi:ankyrin-3-like isoform X2 [Saccostrea echinata]|uniref:ankyrin-3-like isoform X2 n=1 Tax=Saccostrea echinata TaxID=191078 RepID=UPI002A804864|nr:ankyrin-3-like isoform X2 [Saccostrea echinata]
MIYRSFWSSSILKQRLITTSDTEKRKDEECNCTVYIGVIIATVVLLLASVVVNIWYCYNHQLQRCIPNSTYTKVQTDEVAMVEVGENKNIPLHRVTDCPFVDDIDKYILVDYTIENAEIFKLLKIQCLNGVHIGFHYVNKSRVTQLNKNAIFHQRDENGCTLLHYAAQGGSITIFKEILKTDPEINIGIKCFRGQTALHFAVRYKQNKMSEYLITEHRECFMSGDKDLLSVSRIAERDETAIIPNVIGQFEPFHWIAWNGDTWLHHLWKEAHFTVTGLTKNGLNILDIACMNNQYEFCRHIIDNEKEINIEKVDASGWNIAHYATMWNNVKLLELLAEKTESQMILAVTKLDKTTLHIACELGHFEVAKHLAKEYKDLLWCTDNLGWNALHFAVKGGNKQIFELLLKKGLKIDSLTKDKKTLLHIASIYKQIEICKYVAKTFSEHHKELMNQKTTNQGWSAAHYVGVEKRDLRKQKEVIDILRQYGMNLKERTSQGVSVLDVAIVYLDKELIKLILSREYREILDMNKEVILKGKTHTDDKLILKILDDAAEKIEAECR